MYKLTANMYERVKATYGEDVANDINDALRSPEGIESEEAGYVTVSVASAVETRLCVLTQQPSSLTRWTRS